MTHAATKLLELWGPASPYRQGANPNPNTKTIDGKTYSLSWADEFDGPTLDTTKWMISSDDNYWGASGTNTNMNPAYCVPFFENSAIRFPVRWHAGTGRWWGCQIQGQDHKARANLKYAVGPDCYFEIRFKFPPGPVSLNNPNRSGLQAVMWMMPAWLPGAETYFWTQSGVNGGWWPASGEIDLCESVWGNEWNPVDGGGKHMIWTTLIQALNSNPTNWDTGHRISSLPSWGDAWHVMKVHWFRENNTIRFKVWYDDVLSFDATGKDGLKENWDWGNTRATPYRYDRVNFAAPYAGAGSQGPTGSPFDKPFHFLFGHWVKSQGPIPQQDVNPASGADGLTVDIDYVRVYT
jgi:hypothetical protein